MKQKSLPSRHKPPRVQVRALRTVSAGQTTLGMATLGLAFQEKHELQSLGSGDWRTTDSHTTT